MVSKYGPGAERPVWAERIGKKYQWIALYRLMARLADNLERERKPWEPPATSVPDLQAYHRTKTANSFGEIPIRRRALDALRDHLAGLKVRRHDGNLFVSPATNRPWDANGYTRQMKSALLDCWQTTGIEALRTFRGRWLRSTFATLVRKQRADERVLKAHLGHSRNDVLGKHCEEIDAEWMRREIVSRIETLRMREHQKTESAEIAQVTG